ncbi:MAG: two-component system phosphate regulon sensor histidine kinase PhoR, partial [Candidatus Azotimanducaceae bacterium]
MFGSRFLWQIWGVLGFTLIITTVVFGYFVADQVERDALDRVEQNLLIQALALSPTMARYLESGTVLELEEVNRLTPGITARITLIDAVGRVLADNKSNPEEMDNHISRVEVLAAASSSYGVSARYSETLNLSMLYLAIPLRSIDGTQGFLRLALPLTTIEDQLQTLQNRIYVTAGTAGFLFLVIGYFLAYRVTSPIANMTEIARNVAKGEYHLRLPTDRADELGQLSTVINELALGAQDRIDELTSNRNRLAAVLAGLAEGVIAVDLRQRVLHINNAALGMLGLSVEDVLKKNFNELPVTKEIKRAVETCVAEGTSVVSTVRNGDETLECSCIRMDNGGDDGEGVVLVLENVTERRRLEEVRSDFVANASHELKTPISAIRGLVETIIDDPDMPEDVFNRFIERIRLQTIRLDRIVQDLLHLSRFDSSDREKSVTRIELAGLLRQVFNAKTYDAADLNVTLELDIQIDALFVDGETEALNQLVTNLVDNAVKYSGEGGAVVLRLLKKGAMAHIEVEDNGIGISKDETQRIFERFYRVDRARSRDLGGTGLGLAIVKHIAQTHGGNVSVDSHLG